ncbi:MAG TPA: hypothetical protein VEB40_08240 [Flavipsychrobacter sp.]|nr:hypothetical protein [Flavipsychrobacter sp.]
MVTWDNYEEYLVMQADGELDAAGQKELEAFLQAHPELRAEQALYARVKLVRDMNEGYGNKDALLREEPKGRVIRFGNWRQYSAAAGMLLLIALGLMKWNEEEARTIGKVEDTAEYVNTPKVAVVDTAVKEENVAVQEEEATPLMPVQQPKVQQVQVAVEKQTSVRPTTALPERIETVETPQLAVTEPLRPKAELTDIPELPKANEPAPAPEPYRDALAWLPVSEERKQGLNEIKQAVDRRVEQVKEISNSVKNTDLAVKLGKTELFTIRF